MTARTLILTAGATLAIGVPATIANAKIVPAKPVHKINKPVVKTQAKAATSSTVTGIPVIGPTCANVDPAYTLCVGSDWAASQPLPFTATSVAQSSGLLLSPLDNNTQDG
jgi:hypothetical protein